MNEAYLEVLHREAREELTRIDGKTSILLATFGIAVSLVAGAMIAGDVDPSQLSTGWLVAFWLGVALVLASLVLLVTALSPVTRNRAPKEHLSYFGHVAQFAGVAELRAALERLEHGGVDRSLEQTYTLSRIVRRKYRLTTVATGLYAAGVALGGAVATLGS